MQSQITLSHNRAGETCSVCNRALGIGPEIRNALWRTAMEEVLDDVQGFGQTSVAGEGSYRVAAGELRAFVERYERLEAEKKDIVEQQKEVMAEAKGRGYDVKVLRKIMALRKREPAEISEEEAVLEIYKEALGM